MLLTDISSQPPSQDFLSLSECAHAILFSQTHISACFFGSTNMSQGLSFSPLLKVIHSNHTFSKSLFIVPHHQDGGTLIHDSI